MQRVILRIGVALLALWGLGIVLYFALKRDRAGKNQAVADVIDAWYLPTISRAKSRAATAAAEFGHGSQQAVDARTAVVVIKDDLKTKYTNLELSPEDVVARLHEHHI